jgi:hypothetical protein
VDPRLVGSPGPATCGPSGRGREPRFPTAARAGPDAVRAAVWAEGLMMLVRGEIRPPSAAA